MNNRSKNENSIGSILKNSTVKTPWHIVRLLSLFAPLLSMCLPVLYAGHKNVSLITFVASIANHGLDLKALANDKSYLFAVLAIVCAIAFGVAEIICSLFTAAQNGYRRNIVAFTVNFVMLAMMSFLSIGFGARAKAGLIVTFLIYFVKLVLHNAVNKKGLKPYNSVLAALLAASVVASLCCMYRSKEVKYAATKTVKGDLSAVTFNVAAAFGSSLDDTDSMVRCSRFASYMNSVEPDLIGTQEMNSYWLDELTKTMPNYGNYGVKRGGDSEEKNSEMNAVFWNKNKFSLEEQKTFWLSETPDTESKYTYTDGDGNYREAGCYRICSYVVLTEKETAQRLVFMNTHLDNTSEQAADFGAEVILRKIDEFRELYGTDIRIVLTSDFNETQQGDAYKLVADKLNDCTDNSKKTATYREWGYCYTGNEPIDFIFTTGVGNGYTVLDDLSGGYISDHYGIYSDIEF